MGYYVPSQSDDYFSEDYYEVYRYKVVSKPNSPAPQPDPFGSNRRLNLGD